MTTLRRAPAVAQVLLEDPDGTVIAHVPAGRAIVLQGPSEVIWHRIPTADEPALEAGHLAAELAEETGVAVVVLERHVVELAEELAAEGLVEIR